MELPLVMKCYGMEKIKNKLDSPEKRCTLYLQWLQLHLHCLCPGLKNKQLNLPPHTSIKITQQYKSVASLFDAKPREGTLTSSRTLPMVMRPTLHHPLQNWKKLNPYTHTVSSHQQYDCGASSHPMHQLLTTKLRPGWETASTLSPFICFPVASQVLYIFCLFNVYHQLWNVAHTTGIPTVQWRRAILWRNG